MQTFSKMFFVAGVASLLFLSSSVATEEPKETPEVDFCLTLGEAKEIAKELPKVINITWMVEESKVAEGYAVFLFAPENIFSDNVDGIMVLLLNGCVVHSEVVNVGKFREV